MSEVTVLVTGVPLMHHDNEYCKPPCVLHSPFPGPWASWGLDWQEPMDSEGFPEGTMIMVRICPHGIPHPAVEQFGHWVEEGKTILAKHICDGCPCCPEGVLTPELRIMMFADAIKETLAIRAKLRPLVVEEKSDHQTLVPLSQILDGDAKEPEPEDPMINIPSLGLKRKNWGGREVATRSFLLERAKSSYPATREAAQEILDAYDKQPKQVKMDTGPVPPVADPNRQAHRFPEEKDPNKVAELYMRSIQGLIDSQLHKALVLLSAQHVIHGIASAIANTDGYTHRIDSCSYDCGDWFKTGEVETDDNSCLTLKLAILGGYQPQEWDEDDDGKDD